MTSISLLYVTTGTALSILVSVVIMLIFRSSADGQKMLREKIAAKPIPQRAIDRELTEALPGQVILSTNQVSLQEYKASYWSGQASTLDPTSVVRPLDTAQLCRTVNILRNAYLKSNENGLFAIRSGGHSIYSSAIAGGIVIDMGSFQDIVLSKDRSTVTLGPAVRWGRVITTLEAQGLAVAGGRDSNVGAGGLVLGGKSQNVIPLFPN